MKRFKFLLIFTIVLLLATSCSNYSISGEDPKFNASVVEEKNPDGKKTPYFALNNYRLSFNSKKEAISYFKTFKKEYEAKDKDGTSGLVVISYMDNLDLHTVKVVNDIRYVSLDSDPNYAEVGPSYSSMSVNELLDLYEKESRTLLSVMSELSNRKLNSKQEKRLYQIAENLANEFDSEF